MVQRIMNALPDVSFRADDDKYSEYKGIIIIIPHDNSMEIAMVCNIF